MTRVLFAGTPEIAVASLTALVETVPEAQVVGVLSNPDRPVGRKRVVTPGPVSALARTLDLPLLQPERLDGEARDAVTRLRPDLMVVVAYGRIFGPRFLALFRKGAINMHPSLLPRHRGPSPIQAAILSGDAITGVTVQRIGLEMDAGPIIDQVRHPATGHETSPELTQTLGALGARAVASAVAAIDRGDVVEREQDHGAATYCHLITKRDGYVTLSESAVDLDRKVRAYSPWPGVWASWRGRRLQIVETTPVLAEDGEGPPAPPLHTVGSPAGPGAFVGVDNALGILLQTSHGTLAVRRLKPEARAEMDWHAFLNGNRDVVGSRLERIA